jgi:hypothetical protein
MLRKSNAARSMLIAVTVVTMVGMTHSAFANKIKKKLTYEEAWTLCTAELDRSNVLKVEPGQRYAAGAACMLRHGYRI